MVLCNCQTFDFFVYITSRGLEINAFLANIANIASKQGAKGGGGGRKKKKKKKKKIIKKNVFF